MGEMYVSPPVYKIPNEYQGVEYLQTDGTAYISTDFYPTNNSKVVIKVSNFKIANEDESDLKLLGCRSTSSVDAFTLWILAAKINSESKLQPCLLRGQFSDTINEYIQLGDEESGYEYPQLTDWDENTIFTLTLDSSGLAIQYTNTNNEEINVTYALQATPTDFTSLYNLVLFGTNTANEISTAGHSFKIHECLLYEENKLVEWYCPCYKIQNNKIGIYDIINQKFYTNEQGTFLIGNSIESPKYVISKRKHEYKNLPSDYTQVEYIKNNGMGYIDTQVKCSSNIKLEVDFQVEEWRYGFSGAICGINNSTSKITCTIGQSGIFSGMNNSFSQMDNIYDRTQATIRPHSTLNESNDNIYIYAINVENKPEAYFSSIIRIYSFKIIDNNIIIRDFIPAIKNSDGTVGLYDIINNIFYTEINRLPSTYKRLESIESIGNEYINTQYIPNSNTNFFIKFITHNEVGGSSSDNGAIFGATDPESSSNKYELETWTNTTRKGSLYLYKNGYDPGIIQNELMTIGYNSNYQSLTRTDNTYITIPSSTITNIDISVPIYIFAYNKENFGATNYGKLQLFHLIFLEDSTVVHDYIPVLNFNNISGLFDVVDQIFLTSENSSFITHENNINFQTGDIIPLLSAQKVSKVYIPHGIPSEYQQLEWIQASSDLILNSGYIPNYKTEIYGKFSNVPGGSFFGVCYAENNVPTKGIWLTHTEANNFNGMYNTDWSGSEALSIDANDIIETIFNRHSWEIKQNGTLIYSIQKARSVFEFTNTLFILSVNCENDNEPDPWPNISNTKIYSFQIREDDRLLRDYYPVKRKSDGVYGLYDVIQQQFYLPTVGNFSCGDEVIIRNTLKAKQVHKVYGSVNNVAKLIKTYPYLPKEYQQVEYVSTAGNTVLDLGFVANENTGFDIDFIQYKNVTTNGYGTIFGARQSTSARRYVLSSYNHGMWDFGSATRLQSQGMLKSSRQFYSYRYNAFLRPNNTIATISSTASFTTPGNLTLFSLHNTSGTSQLQNGNVRIYSLKFYNMYNKVNDYYPCYRLSDEVAGLYDIVSKQFLTKNAGAALTKGENIIKKL